MRACAQKRHDNKVVEGRSGIGSPAHRKRIASTDLCAKPDAERL
jgi:hypothetical protein